MDCIWISKSILQLKEAVQTLMDESPVLNGSQMPEMHSIRADNDRTDKYNDSLDKSINLSVNHSVKHRNRVLPVLNSCKSIGVAKYGEILNPNSKPKKSTK